MKIYTKTGDRGETSLFGGGRVSKSDLRVVAYGEVDELNSFVGLLIAELVSGEGQKLPEAVALSGFLHNLQNRLFDLGAELATGDARFLAKLPRRISKQDISQIERAIDSMQENLEPLKNFILPGGGKPAALAHVCRAVARRAERAMVRCGIPDVLVAFMNRVSDYFFVLARHLNRLQGIAEPEWEK